MDVDPVGFVEESNEAAEEASASKSRLNSLVAIMVAILATFMGIAKIKDDNIVQQMQQDQAHCGLEGKSAHVWVDG